MRLIRLVAVLSCLLVSNSSLGHNDNAKCMHLMDVDAKSWTTSGELDYNGNNGFQLNDEDVYEISLSRTASALDRLRNKSAEELTVESASYYLRGHYSPVKGKKPFLVRSAFANFTGSYSVWWDKDGKLLQISHESLGGGVACMYVQPLIINLDAMPSVVKVYVSSDM